MKTGDVKVAPKWSRSKEEVWAESFERLEDKPAGKAVRLNSRKRFVRLAAAAVLAIVLLLPAAAFFYTKEVAAPRGMYTSVVLPDGSQVRLNAESKVSFKPLWWRFSRRVNMDGEAYFDVAVGRKFVVDSPSGEVAVLGTGFNIYDRTGAYRVACMSGKVEVAVGAESVILEPGGMASYDGKKLVADSAGNVSGNIGWMSGEFSFSATPLKEVIKEIERQYDIEVAAPAELDYLYTGRFSRAQAPEQVLQIVGAPFGITLKIK